VPRLRHSLWNAQLLLWGTDLRRIYRNLNLHIEALVKEKPVETKNRASQSSALEMATSRSLRVLMQNRPNATSQRGGDTVVMERTAEGLRSAGISVTIDLEGREDPAHYDLVHLFNFATPDFTRKLAERAHAGGTPFVVTTLCEDVARFHNRSLAVAQTLIEYAQNGDIAQYEARRAIWNSQPAAPSFDNSWTVANAAALLTNGANESESLLRQYPNCKSFVVVPLGHEVATADDGSLFAQRYGVKDFVLSVGRFENRKNQLMLLKALEESELTVVLVSGGFSYQPEYDRAVRGFKRKGRTVVVERLSAEELASAYNAARIHALPSWFELPGLVSLEAGSYGRNVVVTDCGTTRDYLGDDAFYAAPDDASSVYNAVMAAYYSPLRQGLQTRARSFTWANTAQATLAVYQRVVKHSVQAVEMNAGSSFALASAPTVNASLTIEQVLEQSEKLAASGEFCAAQVALEDAESRDPHSARIMRSRGAIFLAEGKITEARSYFDRALTVDRRDARSWVGMGMCQMRIDDLVGATQSLQRALESDPDQLVAIRNLIECSYRTSNFGALEVALRRYVVRHESDVEMQFCLAGCLYKMGSSNEAWTWVDSILAKSPTHQGTLELKRLLGVRPVTTLPVYAEPNSSAGLANITAQIERINTSPVSNAQCDIDIVPQSLDEIDNRLMSLEDAKRRAEFEAVIGGCTQLLQRQTIKSAQREHAMLLRAEALVLSGKTEQAVKDLDTVLQSNPRSARALCGQAAIKAHEGRWDEARTLFEQANAIDGRNDVALAGIGLYWLQHNDAERAWGFFERAVEQNPENSRALLGLIEIGYKIGRLEGVERAIHSYLEMHPADVEFLYSLAGCLFAQNKLREATAEIEKIRLFAPNHRDALELSGMIEKRQQQSGGEFRI